MAYTLIPGVMQDERGRCYQHGRYPNGKLISVPVELLPLSVHTQALLQPVQVESMSRLGVVYQSIAFFQGGRDV